MRDGSGGQWLGGHEFMEGLGFISYMAAAVKPAGFVRHEALGQRHSSPAAPPIPPRNRPQAADSPAPATFRQVGFVRGVSGSFVDPSGSLNPGRGFDRRQAGSFAGSLVGKRAKSDVSCAISNANGASSGEDYDKWRV